MSDNKSCMFHFGTNHNHGKVKMSDNKETKLLKKIIRAQARMILAYRVGGKLPEWVHDTLDKAKSVFGDLLEIK